MKIKVEDIEFSYNGEPTLDKINCGFEKGDFVALVGPNGSGKSTFIKCLNGILKVKKGVVLINGNSLNSYLINDLAKEIAYVPQHENRSTATTVFDTVLLGRKPYLNWKPSQKDIQLVAEILKTLNLEHIAMKEVNKLSGGQQQCVYIARALAQEPNILLLDEPIANLDIKHQIEVMELLKTLSAKGITIIIALHDINIAIRYASKIMMIKKGEIFAYGEKEIITRQNIEKLYEINIHIINDNGNIFIVPNGLHSNETKILKQPEYGINTI